MATVDVPKNNLILPKPCNPTMVKVRTKCIKSKYHVVAVLFCFFLVILFTKNFQSTWGHFCILTPSLDARSGYLTSTSHASQPQGMNDLNHCVQLLTSCTCLKTTFEDII